MLARGLIDGEHKGQINVIARQFLPENHKIIRLYMNGKHTYLKKAITLSPSVGSRESSRAER